MESLGQKLVKNVVAESIVGLVVVQVEIVHCPSTPAELLILDTCHTNVRTGKGKWARNFR